jgi:hypothetical protein
MYRNAENCRSARSGSRERDKGTMTHNYWLCERVVSMLISKIHRLNGRSSPYALVSNIVGRVKSIS